MRLLRLEVNGFKSFADRVVFDFEPGVTAFVGPNGCGKSNVVDAVRWILGERSAKAVRGASMEDVIFNGSANRKPKGYAEATLTILNDRGLLPVDFDKVSVTRRLYRSGQSEYMINRQPCRLRDVLELFMDTGVGMHTYSIIEQGRVARLLEANPVERRVIFEEAAGISRYRSQLKSARAKLERTQANLERAQILLDQQESRLRSIRIQAGKAKRWREARERLREIDVRLGLRNYREAEAERAGLTRKIDDLEGRETELSEQLRAAEDALVEIGRRADSLEQEHTARQEELRQVERDHQAAEACVERNQRLLQEYAAATAEALRAVETLEERRARAQGELDEARREYGQVSELVEDQTALVEEQGRQSTSLAVECDRLQDAVERWKTEVLEIRHRAVAFRNEINTLLQSQQQDAAKRQRLDGRARAADQAVAQVVEAQNAIRERQTALEAELEALSERLGAAEQERLEALGLVDAADVELRGLREREAGLRERRDVLAELDAGAEDVEDGVLWLRGGEVRAPGLLGMVADVAHVDLPRYAAAVESALGDHAQSLVFQTTETALAALNRLREEGKGRAGVLPLDRLRTAPDGPDLSGRPGVLGRASDFVRADPGHEALVECLLAAVWVVDDFAAAVALATNGAAGVRLVTLQGDLFEPGGGIVGGEALRRTGIISRRSELGSIEQDLRRLAREIADREQERGRASESAADLARSIEALRARHEEGRRRRHELSTDLQDLERQRLRHEEDRRIIESEIQEIQDQIVAYTAREAQIRRDLGDSETRRERLEQEVVSTQERLEAQREDASRLREQLEELRLTLARREEMCRGLESRVAALERSVREVEEQLERSRQAIESYAAKRRDSEAQIEESRVRMGVSAERREAIREALESMQAEREAARTSRNGEMERGQTLRARHDEVARELSDLRVNESSLGLRMQNIGERLRDDWELSLAEIAAETPGEPAEDAPEEGEVDWEALAAEADELRQKIQRMGGVNTDALDEQEELEAETEWRRKQRDDLDEARKKLHQIIRKINRVCRERFREAFDEVRVNFQDLFRKLFGGGSGDLRLIQEEGEDILDAGIDITARPPGKQPKSIIQLSGGEKTLATVALVFAIFRRKPSPFCILDEVDAALDEANIDRFCAMVKDFLDQSQFIIITHSKRTMGLADTLYGITMMEQGVSTRLAVRMDEAARLAEPPPRPPDAAPKSPEPEPELVAAP